MSRPYWFASWVVLSALAACTSSAPVSPPPPGAQDAGAQDAGVQDGGVPASWSVSQNGTILEIGYGTADHPQYAALHTESSYFRMNPGPSFGFGTSVILLPSFWSGGTLHQGSAVTVNHQTSGENLVLAFEGALSGLTVQGQVTLSPPRGGQIQATVAITSVTGDVVLDANRPGEAFKPVTLSSMHISDAYWDAESAFVGSSTYALPASGWILQPPTPGTLFGLKGGTSTWKTNAPTVEIALDTSRTIAGWVTASTNPNDDNVGLWAATDSVIRSWHYTITAKP